VFFFSQRHGKGGGIAPSLSQANVHVISPFGFPGFELHEHAPSAPDIIIIIVSYPPLFSATRFLIYV